MADLQGPRGYPGQPGHDGAPGRPGSRGPIGLTGPVGPSGARGLQGEKGEPGATGLIGPAGPLGPRGEKGDAGSDGPIGPPGPRGVQGPPGPHGPRGPEGVQGPVGADGTVWRTGTAVPAQDLGEDEDWYLQTTGPDQGVIWQKRAGRYERVLTIRPSQLGGLATGIVRSGTIVPGHVAVWIGPSQIGDGGPIGSAASAIKQTEIDFGAVPVDAATFTIVDPDVSPTSHVLGQIAYEAPTGKDLDELEMDAIYVTCAPGAGQFTLFARGLDGYVAGAFRVNYQVGA